MVYQIIKWTQIEDNFLIENYHKLTSKEIGFKLNRSFTAVRTRARKLGISSKEKARKFHKEKTGTYCNENFFEIPNIENCYWAGFLAADGSLTYKNSLSLQISNKDFEHLQKFSSAISFTGKLSNYIRKNGVGMCAMTIKSEKLCKDLKNNFNIIPKKTFKLIPPNLTDLEHINAYIIGYLDGDGWISLRKKWNYPIIGFVGQKNILEWILMNLAKNLKVDSRNFSTRKIQDYKTYCKVTISNISSLKEILNELQKINVPRLERKWRLLNV